MGSKNPIATLLLYYESENFLRQKLSNVFGAELLSNNFDANIFEV